MSEEILEKINKEIRTIFAEKQDVQQFLLAHERKKKLVDSVGEQLQIAKWKFPGMNGETREKIIKAAVRLFCDIALNNKQKDLISEAELYRRKKEQALDDQKTQLANDIADNKQVITDEHLERVAELF